MIDWQVCHDRPGIKLPRLVATWYSALSFLATIGVIVCPEGGILYLTFFGRADGWRIFGPRGHWRRWLYAIKRIPEYAYYSARGARCLMHYHGKGYL